jgi:hypothetical protein
VFGGFIVSSYPLALRRVEDAMAFASECMFNMQVNPLIVKRLSNGDTRRIDEKTQVRFFKVFVII